MKTGIERIAAERQRQVDVEGYDAAHDEGHASQLMAAAVCYGYSAIAPLLWPAGTPPHGWPWAVERWKPSGSAEHDLVKAGALVAAALDSMTAVHRG